MQDFYQRLGAELSYPAEAQAEGIEGKVFVQMVILEDGSMTQLKVVKGVHKALDAEALRALKAIGLKWIPTKVDGKAVPVRMIMPVSFRL